jgi:hypothetical protein
MEEHQTERRSHVFRTKHVAWLATALTALALGGAGVALAASGGSSSSSSGAGTTSDNDDAVEPTPLRSRQLEHVATSTDMSQGLALGHVP